MFVSNRSGVSYRPLHIQKWPPTTGRRLGLFGPNRHRFAHSVLRETFAHFGLAVAATIRNVRPKIGRARPESGPKSAELDQHWAHVGRSRPKLVEIGQGSNEVLARSRLSCLCKCDRVCPEIGQITKVGPISCHRGPGSTQVDATSAENFRHRVLVRTVVSWPSSNTSGANHRSTQGQYHERF